MSSLTPEVFGDFFQALHGYEPFPWQSRLAERVAAARVGEACWPEALAMPTAAGKTACIDMAVFALACQAARSPAERTAPRRIFFVVDRRVIVDETFARADRLAAALAAVGDDDGILGLVAGRLRTISGEDDPSRAPLDAFQLRGGMYRDDAWARSPLQPTVVVTTVDQFASRLLFRGYGSSPGMRPIHAGLAANDCLVLLDEAHCANPFRQTVTSVRRYRQWAEEPGAGASTPFHLTLISATPPPEIAEHDRFTAGDEDRGHPVLGRRIGAAKPARLVTARNARGDQAQERLAERIAAEALGMAADEVKAVGVLVNRVATARMVHEKLTAGGGDAILLTGRMRAIDRDDAVLGLEPLKTGAAREDRRRFIVATQTLEVGADLDFDGLVTECASLDALQQRFGRLNRAGRDLAARASIVVRADQANPNSRNAFDPIYGMALAETCQWLRERAAGEEINFGYAAMDALLQDCPAGLERLHRQEADAPVMLPAHMDAWVQTSPVPAPDPDVAIFLHGPDRGAPEVQVCWRADLSEGDLSEGRAVDIVSLCPPASGECIPAPIHVLRRWLEGDEGDPGDSDLEGTPLPRDEHRSGAHPVRRRVLLWRGPADSRVIAGPDDLQLLRSGDTVVVPQHLGGWDVFGHVPPDADGNLVIDLGDRAHLQSRARTVLRVHPRLVESWPECPAKTRFVDLARWSEDSEEDVEDADIRQSLADLAGELARMDLDHRWAWLMAAAAALAGDIRLGRLSHPGGGMVLQGSRRLPGFTASTLTSEDDSYSATVPVTMDDHLSGVEGWTRRFAQGLGMPESLVNDLALAARLHDVGKADPRFQAMLRGGHPWAGLAGGPLLAKSGRLPTSGAELRRARRQSGYPQGGRHELLAVRLIESAPGLLDAAADRALVLHLVASHHGCCRPFAPVVMDREPVAVTSSILGHPMSAGSATGLERLDSGVPERFWMLVRRYGWWGLAWLEALMRLADHRSSEAEQRAGGDG